MRENIGEQCYRMLALHRQTTFTLNTLNPYTETSLGSNRLDLVVLDQACLGTEVKYHD